MMMLNMGCFLRKKAYVAAKWGDGGPSLDDFA